VPIIWRPQMSLGNALLDGDHRYLMCLINTVELAMRTASDRDILNVAFDQLEEYTHEHFRREERLQIELRYAQYDRHKQAHLDLTARLALIRKQCEEHANDAASTDKDFEALTALLRSWLLDHVLKEDMLMKPMLAEHAQAHRP
jgi:hemerythrin